MTAFPIKEKAAQLITQQNIYNSPHPTFTLTISVRFPLEITMIAPVTEIIIPATFIRCNLSLKKYAARRAINIGLFAIMSEARPALIILSPLKKKTLYENTPVIPRSITGMICPLFSMGSVPSAFQVSKRRKTEAIANRKKAAENGPTFFATSLPAIKVPPQKIAVSNNFTYTNIVEPLFIFSHLRN